MNWDYTKDLWRQLTPTQPSTETPFTKISLLGINHENIPPEDTEYLFIVYYINDIFCAIS